MTDNLNVNISIAPKQAKKKPKAQFKRDEDWVKAKAMCRLNQEDIEMAKKLGIKPPALIKNIPSPKQRWKAPVKQWIRELYEKRFGCNANG